MAAFYLSYSSVDHLAHQPHLSYMNDTVLETIEEFAGDESSVAASPFHAVLEVTVKTFVGRLSDPESMAYAVMVVPLSSRLDRPRLI